MDCCCVCGATGGTLLACAGCDSSTHFVCLSRPSFELEESGPAGPGALAAGFSFFCPACADEPGGALVPLSSPSGEEAPSEALASAPPLPHPFDDAWPPPLRHGPPAAAEPPPAHAAAASALKRPTRRAPANATSSLPHAAPAPGASPGGSLTSMPLPAVSASASILALPGGAAGLWHRAPPGFGPAHAPPPYAGAVEPPPPGAPPPPPPGAVVWRGDVSLPPPLLPLYPASPHAAAGLAVAVVARSVGLHAPGGGVDGAARAAACAALIPRSVAVAAHAPPPPLPPPPPPQAQAPLPEEADADVAATEAVSTAAAASASASATTAAAEQLSGPKHDVSPLPALLGDGGDDAPHEPPLPPLLPPPPPLPLALLRLSPSAPDHDAAFDALCAAASAAAAAAASSAAAASAPPSVRAFLRIPLPPAPPSSHAAAAAAASPAPPFTDGPFLALVPETFLPPRLKPASALAPSAQPGLDAAAPSRSLYALLFPPLSLDEAEEEAEAAAAAAGRPPRARGARPGATPGPSLLRRSGAAPRAHAVEAAAVDDGGAVDAGARVGAKRRRAAGDGGCDIGDAGDGGGAGAPAAACDALPPIPSPALVSPPPSSQALSFVRFGLVGFATTPSLPSFAAVAVAHGAVYEPAPTPSSVNLLILGPDAGRILADHPTIRITDFLVAPQRVRCATPRHLEALVAAATTGGWSSSTHEGIGDWNGSGSGKLAPTFGPRELDPGFGPSGTRSELLPAGVLLVTDADTLAAAAAEGEALACASSALGYASLAQHDAHPQRLLQLLARLAAACNAAAAAAGAPPVSAAAAASAAAASAAASAPPNGCHPAAAPGAAAAAAAPSPLYKLVLSVPQLARLRSLAGFPALGAIAAAPSSHILSPVQPGAASALAAVEAASCGPGPGVGCVGSPRFRTMCAEEASRSVVADPPQLVRDAVKLAARHVGGCRHVVCVAPPRSEALAAARLQRSIVAATPRQAVAFLEARLAEARAEGRRAAAAGGAPRAAPAHTNGGGGGGGGGGGDAHAACEADAAGEHNGGGDGAMLRGAPHNEDVQPRKRRRVRFRGRIDDGGAGAAGAAGGGGEGDAAEEEEEGEAARCAREAAEAAHAAAGRAGRAAAREARAAATRRAREAVRAAGLAAAAAAAAAAQHGHAALPPKALLPRPADDDGGGAAAAGEMDGM